MMSDRPKLSWEQAVEWLRGQPQFVDLVRDCYYDDPLVEAARRFYDSEEWRAVRRELPLDAGKVLEIGAGRGIASMAFARDGWKVTALEPDPSAVVGASAISKVATDMGVAVEIVREWGESLPFADHSFDVVYCRAVLHHAQDINKICAEIARVLRAGGQMIATREHVISKPADLDAFLKSHPLHSLYGGEHAFQLKTYLSAIRSAGLKVTKTLNSFASDINLYPQTTSAIRLRAAARLGVSPKMIPNVLLRIYGALDRTPGRLYTFVATKNR